MRVADVELGDSFARYISKVRSTYKNHANDNSLPFKVKILMEELFASATPDEPWIVRLIEENRPATELYRDPDFGFIQMGHSHPRGHRNSPHDQDQAEESYITDVAAQQRGHSNVHIGAMMASKPLLFEEPVPLRDPQRQDGRDRRAGY